MLVDTWSPRGHGERCQGWCSAAALGPLRACRTRNEATRIIFNVTPYPTPYVSGQFVCSFNCNSVRSLILIKLPAAKLNQLPKQTSSVLTMAANLPSQQAPLSTCPRHTLQGPAAWHSCTDGGARDGSTAGRGHSPASPLPAAAQTWGSIIVQPQQARGERAVPGLPGEG